MNNPRLDSTLYRVYVPTSICTKSKKSKKSIDLVIPHYSDHISTEANIHIQSKQRQQMTWIKSRGSRDKTRSNTAVAIFQCSLILLICLDVEINVMDMVVMPSFIAKVKHRHRFCSATHRIQLRKWLASVRRADSSSTAGLLTVTVPVPVPWQWAVAVGVDVDVVTDTQTQCQLYDYRTTTFHLR